MTKDANPHSSDATRHEQDDQALLFDLPAAQVRGNAPIASPQQKSKSKRRDRSVKPSPVDKHFINPDPSRSENTASNPQIVFVDPFLIEPEPFNGRGLAMFDPAHNRELIKDMRIRGNTVPVRLRPKSDGEGWTCPSGSRRVNSARVIAADDPEFRVAAIIDANMTDAQAYDLCLSDNHGRSEVTPIQRGREIQWAIKNLYAGSRQAYLDDHSTHPSVVSRALELVNLPEKILACAVDREALPTVFAEKLAPRLKDPTSRKHILALVKALGDKRLPAAQLLRYLLGSSKTVSANRQVIKFGQGRSAIRASVIVSPDTSTILKLPPKNRVSGLDKELLADFIRSHIGDVLG